MEMLALLSKANGIFRSKRQEESRKTEIEIENRKIPNDIVEDIVSPFVLCILNLRYLAKLVLQELEMQLNRYSNQWTIRCNFFFHLHF